MVLSGIKALFALKVGPCLYNVHGIGSMKIEINPSKQVTQAIPNLLYL
jgi:hypothetical protein